MLETALSGLVNTMSGQIFTTLTPMMYYGTEMNALNFGVKMSKSKVTVE